MISLLFCCWIFLIESFELQFLLLFHKKGINKGHIPQFCTVFHILIVALALSSLIYIVCFKVCFPISTVHPSEISHSTFLFILSFTLSFSFSIKLFHFLSLPAKVFTRLRFYFLSSSSAGRHIDLDIHDFDADKTFVTTNNLRDKFTDARKLIFLLNLTKSVMWRDLGTNVSRLLQLVSNI